MDNFSAQKITTEDFAAIVQGAKDLALRAASTFDAKASADLARAAKDLVAVAQSFKAESITGGFKLDR